MNDIRIFGTSWRVNSHQKALTYALSAVKFAGISRVSKINGLAGLAVPIFSVARPSSRVSITVCSGKGTTDTESRLSGLYEAIEVACAEKPIPTIVSQESDFEKNSVVAVAQFGIDPISSKISWTRVTDYESGRKVWAPSVAVALLPTEFPFLPDSNGLASGGSVEESLFHGLLEVLERHAYSLALVFRKGISVDLSSPDDPFTKDALGFLIESGLSLEIKDLSQWTGVPTYYCLIGSAREADSHLVNGGLGTHLDPLIALRRALTEAFQSRAIAVAGAREDITSLPRIQGNAAKMKYQRYRFWMEPTATKVPFPRSIDPIPFKKAISLVLETSRSNDPELGRFLYYTFPSPNGIFVTRSLLEASENFALNRKRMGRRIRQIYREMESKYAQS